MDSMECFKTDHAARDAAQDRRHCRRRAGGGTSSGRIAGRVPSLCTAGEARRPPIPWQRRERRWAPRRWKPSSSADNLTMLSGPGGNVVVLNGPGRQSRGGFIRADRVDQAQAVARRHGQRPNPLLIDTHWHFDHTDNNWQFPRRRRADPGARKHQEAPLGSARPAGHAFCALAGQRPADADLHQPRTACRSTAKILLLGYIPPAHTDTDIYIQYPRANVHSPGRYLLQRHVSVH